MLFTKCRHTWIEPEKELLRFMGGDILWGWCIWEYISAKKYSSSPINSYISVKSIMLHLVEKAWRLLPANTKAKSFYTWQWHRMSENAGIDSLIWLKLHFFSNSQTYSKKIICAKAIVIAFMFWSIYPVKQSQISSLFDGSNYSLCQYGLTQ